MKEANKVALKVLDVREWMKYEEDDISKNTMSTRMIALVCVNSNKQRVCIDVNVNDIPQVKRCIKDDVILVEYYEERLSGITDFVTSIENSEIADITIGKDIMWFA